MSGHVEAAPVENKFLTPGVKVLFLLFGVGIVVAIYRIFAGLAAVTNLTNQYPWGLWIGVDVSSGVALAAGGFTTAALIHIFWREKYAVLGRPAHLTAMLGYTFVAIGLLFDLGRWYNIWHPLLPSMWQGNSVLFEVGMCVMLYLTVLYIEFIPVVTERFIGRSPKWIDAILRFFDKIFSKIMWIFIILGVVLSCLHQSSLGNLMVIAPYKMHPLWYTPLLPLLFLVSAIAVGFPMVIFESMWASRSLGRKPEIDVLAPLARMIPVTLGLYLIMKIVDLTIRQAWGYMFEGSLQSTMFIIEFFVGIVIPLVILLFEKARRSAKMLFWASFLYIFFGVLINRVNVFFIAYKPQYAVKQYVPSIWEFLVTIGLISALAILYRAFVTIFPILPAHQEKA
ncbi:Ni/Fe-hydrogenase cytochrome b subunit [candidate division KSB1 bacterium 4484_87]|nr:MAG: Ni/Fe-hydrogenase cytochrome b subunit [candidate division KSB1 bacterium 4484_87]